MEPRKPRSKTLALIIFIALILLGFGAYYATALSNSDNRPAEVERES